jgi:AcrR family transcriptional regulator
VIVAAAARLVDEEGVDALSMRAVAARLDTGAMSLYRHVSGHEELLDLVLARFVADLPVRADTADWRADLAVLARDVHAALTERPSLTVLMTSRAASPGGLAALDRALGILRRAGLEPAQATHANHALGNYVAGAALWQAAGLGGATGDARAEAARQARSAAEALAGEGLPNVAWAVPALFAGTADDRFEFGLGLILDGIAGLAPRA